MNIRRLVLDVDKAVSRPSVVDIARAIKEFPGVHGVNLHDVIVRPAQRKLPPAGGHDE